VDLNLQNNDGWLEKSISTIFKKQDHESFALALSDPVSWGRSFLKNRDGSKRDYWPHQKENLRCKDTNIIHLDGRDVGKSIALSTDALHFAFITQGGKGLIAAPQQG
jgi:hypothetical protein